MEPTGNDYAHWALITIDGFWKDFSSFRELLMNQWIDFYSDYWPRHVANLKENLQLTTDLANQVAELKSLLLIAAVVIGCLVILFGTLILINQRKTHKLLRELRQAQDKPSSAPQEMPAPEEDTSASPVSTDPGPDSPPS